MQVDVLVESTHRREECTHAEAASMARLAHANVTMDQPANFQRISPSVAKEARIAQSDSNYKNIVTFIESLQLKIILKTGT